MVINILSTQNSKKNFNKAYKLDTKILCHGNHIILLYTLTGIGALSNLLTKLQPDPALFKEYGDKIKEQLVDGIAEKEPRPRAMAWNES